MANIKFGSADTDDSGAANEKRRQSTVINMTGAGAGQADDSDGHLRRSAHNNSALTMPSVDVPAGLHDDFNWDSMSENGADEDPNDEGARKVTGFWRMHPLVRALCIMISGGIILIIPTVAVLASHKDLPFRSPVDPEIDNYQFKYNLQCVARSFALLAAVWVFGTLIYHLVDMIPDGALRIVRIFKGKRNIEKLKDRMQFFIAVKMYIKMILISATSLIAFVIMFPNASYRFIGRVENGKASWDQVLFQVNVLMLFACAIIGLEKLILKVIATRFHKSAYKERLEQQTYASWVLDHLNRAREANNTSEHNTPFMGSNAATFDSNVDAMASSKELLPQGGSKAAGDDDARMRGIADGYQPAPNTPPALGKANSGSSSFWRRNTFTGSRPKHQKAPSVSFASKLWNIKDRALDGGVDMNSNQYAARLARKLFSALNNDRDYLVVDDFLPFFEKEEEAIKAFEMFDKDNNGDISKREMRDRVLTIYKERRALISALSDMSQVVGKLDMFLTVFALLVIVILALLIFGLDPLKSLATMGTLFIGWSFVFGNTFKTVFECIVFLFQIHSYDVGDTVIIATESLTVHKIRLLSTVFYKTDGTYTVYPNNVLATMKIQNLRRSAPQSESIIIGIDFNTPSEKIYALRDRMNEYVDENPRDFSGPIGFNVDLLENTNRIQISVGLNYKNNWQDGGTHYRIKTAFAFALRHAIKDLGLRYALPLQPVTMVSSPPGYDELNAPEPGGNGDGLLGANAARPRTGAAGSDDEDDLFGGSYYANNGRNQPYRRNNSSAYGPGNSGADGGGGGNRGGNADSSANPAAAIAATAAIAGSL
ncbi:hypothetical protein LPJ56_002124 [Coemansia sp. RSA 2599]|nr:hypothetical protein LPJ75_001784 [Coemansia sp. RSA 2598]KAJ1826543.1 hypothetical protein LPJ56_002124 [Coemansia sp. RSA 2599]